MSTNATNIKDLENEIEALSATLETKKEELQRLRESEKQSAPAVNTSLLTNSEISRFSRQIILPEIGVKGQIALRNANVLIVGAGGLGCPSALYLCGAGIGHIGIVDYDTVELNNLHRQIVHQEQSIGIPKSVSIKEHLAKLNSSIKVTAYQEQLNSQNALEITQNYDIVLDATDNVATRYLLNDACVFGAKPLVSGSALQFEGQLTVYNYRNGPCYRCLFPKPPPPETVMNCGDGGVIGAITGIIGTLQALEAIKIITGIETTLSGRLLLFDGINSTFRNVKLRRKSVNCEVCAEPRKITSLIDYEQFCGMKASDKDMKLEILPQNQRVSVQILNERRQNNDRHLLIDVRSENEYEICQLNRSENYPIKIFQDENSISRKALVDRIKGEKIPQVYVICRRGNDSQIAAKKLIEELDESTATKVHDIIGGLHAWTHHIDTNFPKY
ncbi:adenylyltransferase and sulfurtransferase MOCS3 [Sitodiplosis mosellana]|uniref:adenylyltransferase and sulfurtransferase MOCS3 n=1 Tax=Sitodiplosis mosellana TaxID=263140 RepID=UPI002444101F|nr:adenylyltransferase and sulfurtransferase MOCS3 [Sitodiplosis mosellana]